MFLHLLLVDVEENAILNMNHCIIILSYRVRECRDKGASLLDVLKYKKPPLSFEVLDDRYETPCHRVGE